MTTKILLEPTNQELAELMMILNKVVKSNMDLIRAGTILSQIKYRGGLKILE